MKKLYAFIVVLLFTGFTLAQHTDVVNQTGDGNAAYVDQGFMPAPGPGLPGNEAYVDQIGNGNDADVDQLNGGFAGDAHYAKVYQSGNGNTGNIFQERSAGDALVQQLGNGNWADIFQTGNFNTVTPYQPYDAYAFSQGNGNVITIDIWGTNSTAYAKQVGNGNNIDQDLGTAYGEKVESSDFEAHQYGNDNEALQWMDGQGFAGGITALDNFGKIYQDGNGNTAIQRMTENSFPAAANNYANAFQDGNGNWSEQNQAGAGNSSIHSQVGNGNVEVTNQN
jgi:hypothetical protein